MLLEYFSYLVVVMWLAWHDMNGGADIRMYSFLVGPDVMDAKHTSEESVCSKRRSSRFLPTDCRLTAD